MDDFLAFVEKDAQVGKSLDLEWRLYNFLAPKYVESYQHQLKESKRDPTLEWFQRCHLLVDHISGMTDNYALTTYQMVQGISASVGGQFA